MGGKVVISVERLMGSHLSLFDFFRFPKGPVIILTQSLSLFITKCSTQLGGFLFLDYCE